MEESAAGDEPLVQKHVHAPQQSTRFYKMRDGHDCPGQPLARNTNTYRLLPQADGAPIDFESNVRPHLDRNYSDPVSFYRTRG